jgi:phosphoenolpyruvate-protein phosphotransferase
VRDLDHVELKVVSGIGLFRTEFAFMERRQFPAEDEQVEMYRSALERTAGKVLTFRTLDVGGDKPLGYFRTPEERNPVLGWRGLRISMDWPDIFFTQVRAILRASAVGHARILLPMVTTLDEIKQCRDMLEHILMDLRATRVPHDENIELGAMVEVPALVPILEQVLPHVDFLSVGTNDLVQYLLAVDRDNPRVAGMYDPFHPSVLRVLRTIAKAAETASKPVSICGEIAGDHYFTPLLLGLGFRELSMAPVFLPRVKLMVRSFAMEECRSIAAEALAMDSAKSIRTLVREHSRRRWSHFLDRAAKSGA